jgi:hypothetical protein
MKWIARAAATSVCLVLLAGTGWALLPNFTKVDLIQQSESIVMGTVLEVNSSWSVDHSGIFTYVRLEIRDQFKGQPVGQEITLQIPGGRVGEITQVVSDAPSFDVGQQVLVHVYTQDTGYPGVYGWEKGSLTVMGEAIPDYNMTIEQFRHLVETTAK